MSCPVLWAVQDEVSRASGVVRQAAEEGGHEDDLLGEEREFCRTKRPGVQIVGQFWVWVAGVLGWYRMGWDGLVVAIMVWP